VQPQIIVGGRVRNWDDSVPQIDVTFDRPHRLTR
jgi:hypothetical protein